MIDKRDAFPCSSKSRLLFPIFLPHFTIAARQKKTGLPSNYYEGEMMTNSSDSLWNLVASEIDSNIVSARNNFIVWPYAWAQDGHMKQVFHN